MLGRQGGRDHPDRRASPTTPHTREVLEQKIGFIAPITVYPGEDELLALAQGALRVLKGEEEPKEY